MLERGTTPTDGPPGLLARGGGPPAGARGPGGRGSTAAVGLLLVAAVAVLGWHAAHGVDATNDLAFGWWRDAAERAEDRFDCLAEGLVGLVPPGGRVAVTAQPGDEEWRQRVLELVDRRARVVEAGGGADATLVVRFSEPASAEAAASTGPPRRFGVDSTGPARRIDVESTSTGGDGNEAAGAMSGTAATVRCDGVTVEHA